MGFNEAASALTESLPNFLRSYIFPSLVTLGLVVIFLAPAWEDTALLALFSVQATNEFAHIMLFVFVAVVIALFSAFCAPSTLYLLIGHPERFLGWFKKRKFRVFEKLQEDSESDNPIVSRRAVQRLARYYPASGPEIGPTTFGNVLRGSSTYGVDRFGLDSQAFWYELCSVSADGIASEVEDTHKAVDFHVGVLIQAVLLALASAVTIAHSWVVASTDKILLPALVVISSLLLVRLAYVAAVDNLCNYRNAIQAMVNLGRPKLAKAFGLQLPVSNSNERAMWQALSGVVEHRGPQEDHDQVLEDYRIPIPDTYPHGWILPRSGRAAFRGNGRSGKQHFPK